MAIKKIVKKNPSKVNSKYSQKQADIICEKIMDGYSLRKIEAKTGIKRLWVLKWLRETPDFQTQYAHAREEQAETLVEEIIDLADEEPKTTLNKFGAEVVDNGRVTHQKNRVDARKWNAAKLKPKKYGDKITQELTGKDGKDLGDREFTIMIDKNSFMSDAENTQTEWSLDI
jgi:hypothetical protein